MPPTTSEIAPTAAMNAVNTLITVSINTGAYLTEVIKNGIVVIFTVIRKLTKLK